MYLVATSSWKTWSGMRDIVRGRTEVGSGVSWQGIEGVEEMRGGEESVGIRTTCRRLVECGESVESAAGLVSGIREGIERQEARKEIVGQKGRIYSIMGIG